jgi:hypothetical protein
VSLREFHELDRFEITGRGTAIIVEPVVNRAALRGQHVLIDGVEYEVRSVENCLVPGHHEGKCPLPTGLLVEPVLSVL